MTALGWGVARCGDHGDVYRTRERVERGSPILTAEVVPADPTYPQPVASTEATCPVCGRFLEMTWVPA